MKTKEFWTRMQEFVFFTTPEMGWQKNWDVLMFEDEPVTSMFLAKQLVREHMKGQTVGLAEFDQMSMDNAQWDNL
jgi:hypothetical protein